MEKVPSISSEINKDLMSKITYKNFNDVSPYFYKLITEWMSDAYKLFNDMDKFLIMIYMINTDFEFYRRNNLNIKYEDFYNEKSLEVPKIKLSKISEDLGIPKKVLDEKSHFLKRKKLLKKGKQIFIDRTAYEFQKPNNTLKNLSQMLRAFSKILKKENLLDESFDNLEISKMIKNNFSFVGINFSNLYLHIVLGGENISATK